MEDKSVKVADHLAKAAKIILDNKDSGKEFDLNELIRSIKDRFMRFAAALIMEKDKDGLWVISIGRVSWWLAFGPALYVFIAAFMATTNVNEASEMISRDITPNHLTILLTLAAYNFGKKAIDTVEKVMTRNSQNSAPEPTDGPG